MLFIIYTTSKQSKQNYKAFHLRRKNGWKESKSEESAGRLCRKSGFGTGLSLRP